ncbi:hypothetical protein VTK73DRAFT_9261 [Phialemonium thermophilum]|uniref:Mitochondrial import inner membrane translocase subunit TIM22 n=1 Tax=Phialemonium thermophilum TaxID=223376 RepID=A0ABR3XMA4_9PEZI
MNFPGGGSPGVSQYDPNDPNVKWLSNMMESCYAKTVMSGVAGFGLGGMFGMFMASMAYDTPFQNVPATTATAGKTATTSGTTTTSVKAAADSLPSVARPAGSATATAASATAASATAAASSAATTTTPLSSLPLRRQLAVGFKDMGSRSYSTAKNFGAVGALFSGIECGIEGLRAKNDLANGVAAGCLTGAILARNAGPQAAAVGCAGFAAFSAAIDAWMRMPKDE